MSAVQHQATEDGLETLKEIFVRFFATTARARTIEDINIAAGVALQEVSDVGETFDHLAQVVDLPMHGT